MKRKEELLLLFTAVLGVGFAGYNIYKQRQTASNATPMGPTTVASGYDPTAVSNIGGSFGATSGIPAGTNIANSQPNDTPIGVDPLTGNTINTISGQTVDPSSWQGTTNQSGSLTYLGNQLAGEGSSIAALQGETY